MKIKVCGVRSRQAADALEKAGADFVGLNFVPWSKRVLDLAKAQAVLSTLNHAIPVGVFCDQDLKEVENIAQALGLRWIQLHGSEPVHYGQVLQEHHRLIKAFSVDHTLTPESLEQWAPYATYFLLDGPRAGSGTTFDWSQLQGLSPSRPYFLAGGLNPENVTLAIQKGRPFGVDTASGVEVDGAESPQRIRDFIQAARSCD